MWRVIWKPATFRRLKRLEVKIRRRIVDSVDSYAETGRGDVKALRGDDADKYRLRVGSWRVVFIRNDDELVLTVVRVGPRGDVYK